MNDLVPRTYVDERRELRAPPTRIFLLWINAVLTEQELLKIKESINSFIDAEVTPTWTLVKFDAEVSVATIKHVLKPEHKYLLQLNADATVLSANFNLEAKQAKMMREFLDRGRKLLLSK